jgi:lauroyl/myristoyl acyltransferase
MRFLNPIQSHAENRYLAGRIVIRDNRTDVALRAMMECLGRNELVGITVGDQGIRVEEAHLFEGVLGVATGPINLSERTGAMLLPVFLDPAGSTAFEVRVEPPLRIPAGMPRGEAYRSVVAEYARLVEDYVRAHPLMWRGWVEHGNWKPNPTEAAVK